MDELIADSVNKKTKIAVYKARHFFQASINTSMKMFSLKGIGFKEIFIKNYPP